MSNIVVFDQGESLFGQAMVAKTAPVTPYKVRLFSNNHTPASADTESNYTEVTGGGYAAVTLTTADWTITPGHPTTLVHDPITFTFTGTTGGSGLIYGWYLTDNNGKALAGFLLGAVKTPQTGYFLDLTITLTIDSVTQ